MALPRRIGRARASLALAALACASGPARAVATAGSKRRSSPATPGRGADDGQDADLVIDATGDWHVVYVDAARGQLHCLEVKGGLTPGVASVVDDGSSVAGQSFPDGVHLVGAGAELRFDSAGAPRVYHGDATVGTLRVASGARTGSGPSLTYKWTLTDAVQPGRFAGLFPLPLADGTKVGNAYRALDAAGETHGDYVFVAAP